MCVSSGRARGGDRVAFDRGKKSCESRPDQYADHRNCEEHLGNARPQMARSSLEARAQGAECPDGKCGTAAGTRKGGGRTDSAVSTQARGTLWQRGRTVRSIDGAGPE